MIEMIDWSKLKTYQNYKHRSFEELCYQIAKELHGEEGRFTSVDDSGGGDGVEFYITLPNGDGDQWGWQAKFYYPDDRLNVSNRKDSIKKSLKKACEIHPHLKKWILCTPTDFTPDEQIWFENTLPQSIPEDMSVELEHWGNSGFNDWLSKPRFSGKFNYFFGELELDMDWFERQFDKQQAAVGEKFSASLHTETQVDAYLHALLGDKGFVRQITEWIEKLNGKLSDLNKAIDDLNRWIPNGIEWDEGEKSKVIGAAESLQDVLANTINQLEQAKEFLNEERPSEAQAIDWESVLTPLKEARNTYKKVTDEFDTSKIKYTGEKEYEERALRKATEIVRHPGYLIADLLDDVLHSAIERCKLINQTELNILGEAGIGKTHIACNICYDRLKTELPALFIRGIRFTSDRPIEEQLLRILDIPSSYSWNDFLQALVVAAEAYHTRIPLIIDGINESTHNGAFSNVWRLGLQGLVQEIAQGKNLVLITTCRTSYKEAIWADKDPPNTVYAEGFDTDEAEQAIDKHFKAYNIKADLTAAPLTQFEHPIYLKIFCESKNRDRNTEKHIYVGEQTLFEVFEEYLKQCNQAVCDRLGLHSRTSVVEPTLNKMAKYLWEYSRRDIPFEELARIVDGQPPEELDWLSSKTHAIVAEGLLVYRDWADVDEVVHFTYDLLGGYLIAKYLVQQATDDVQGFLHREETVAALFSTDYQTLHPMDSDIGRCLAALLPAETGQFLHKLSDNEIAFGLSIRALFEISPQYISKECINLVADLFEEEQNREKFFKLGETTVGHIDHPFNASFWLERLSALSMPERDLSWTEYVRQNVEGFEKMLIRFEVACQSEQELSDISEARLNLWAKHIMWLLTSTVRPLRDKATRALYWYGRRFPQEFFDLVMKSLSVNDPYIPERMLAATYGIAMARQHDFKDANFAKEMLPLYGRKLYKTMFKPHAPHSTTHILARDYAIRTIDIALIHHPNLLTDDERKYITPPFTEGGIREWGESEDKNAGGYGAPLKRDFANYTLGGLVEGRRNYDFEHDEHKRVQANIFWRICNLGYSLDSFVKIDQEITQGNWNNGRSTDGGKTDRYGKKYSWIAFYELVGFRQDKDLLPDYYDDPRISDADIDPSFPDALREYKLVTEDFLGDREISAQEWVSKSADPDLTPYLKVDQLCGAQGPWVLLDGYLSQKDDQVSRDMFTFLRGLIVKAEESEEIVEKLKQEKTDGLSTPRCPEDHYTYAGEIPWCDTYPKKGWEAWSFRPRMETVEAEQKKDKKFKILVPVRKNCWEDYHSAIVAGRNVVTPSRQIAKTFRLHGQPQSFDLFEKDGRRASITFRYGEELDEMQQFTYLREDLLERYLAEINGELIWEIWGERRLAHPNQPTPYKTLKKIKIYGQS